MTVARDARSAIDLVIPPNNRVRTARGVVATVARFRYPLIRRGRFATRAANPSLTQESTDMMSRRIGVRSAPNLVSIGVSVAPGTSNARADQVRAMLDTLQSRRSPRARVKALAHQWLAMRELVARYGCPFGTLAAELDRRDDGLDREAVKPIGLILDWAEDQFRQLGRRDARELAIAFFASVQGAALLANALRDPDVMTGHMRHLERWIDGL